MSNNIGWISLQRGIRNHWLWTKGKKPKSSFEAWIDLLMMVNRKEEKVSLGMKLINVKIGQRITSIKQLSERWKWSRSKVKRFLFCLQNDSMLTFKTDTQKTVITVTNYYKYQIERKQNEQRTNNERTTNEQRTNTNNNNNNDDKDNKKEKNTCLNFETFWEMYGKKVDKKDSLNKFNKISESDKQKILIHLPLYIKSKPDKQYRVSPYRYLNKEKYNDEIGPFKNSKTGGIKKNGFSEDYYKNSKPSKPNKYY
jgi:hypothetical protein